MDILGVSYTEQLLAQLRDDSQGETALFSLKKKFEGAAGAAAFNVSNNHEVAKEITKRFFRLLWDDRQNNHTWDALDYIAHVFTWATVNYMEKCKDAKVLRFFSSLTSQELKKIILSVVLDS